MMPPPLHAACYGLAHPADESMLAREIGTIGQTMGNTAHSLRGIKSDYSKILTFVSAFDECLIDVMLSGMFQDVEETQVDSVRLFQDDVQQHLSGLDWTISQRLDCL